MQGPARFGFGIAALFAAGVAAVYLFGDHESWFVRAARDNAVRCLTQSPCAEVIDANIVRFAVKPPLGAGSLCAKGENWKPLGKAPGGPILLSCTDGRAYLYHMGKLTGREAGNEQWTVCGEASCKAEAKLFSN